MSPGSHARAEEPSDDPSSSRSSGASSAWRRWGRWRVGTPAVFLLSGALFVVSATNSEGTDLRPGRYTDLASLVQTESDKYDDLVQDVRELDAEVTNLAAGVKDANVKRFQRKVQSLKDPAGLAPRAGPGLTVTLSDAPEDVINTSPRDPNLLVVHQQDIQAVVNAMWKGGARAVTVQGQRIVSTTGIRCEGNSVQLQGVPYPQPYVISAVGDQAALVAAIEGDDYLDVYRGQADDPTIAVGWELDFESLVTAPAYNGLLDIDYAEPIR